MKKYLTLFLSLVVIVLSGCFTSNGTFPQATANFAPKRTYTIAFDKLWTDVLDTLDKNRITTIGVDKSSGVIQTDYIAGVESFKVMISQNTRYKYTITVRSQPDDSVKMNIVCKVESSFSGHGSSQWNDVTPQNTALASNLENWLYEQIEQGMK